MTSHDDPRDAGSSPVSDTKAPPSATTACLSALAAILESAQTWTVEAQRHAIDRPHAMGAAAIVELEHALLAASSLLKTITQIQRDSG